MTPADRTRGLLAALGGIRWGNPRSPTPERERAPQTDEQRVRETLYPRGLRRVRAYTLEVLGLQNVVKGTTPLNRRDRLP